MTFLSEQERIRREKLKALRKLGINPYPAALYPVDQILKPSKRTLMKVKPSP